MIDRAVDRLRSWVRSVVGEIEVSLDPPRSSREGVGVGLYLMQVMPHPAARGASRPPLQVSLRYLVTTWSDEVEEAHRLLGELIFAALEEKEFEVESEAVEPAVWAALGTPPLPCFVLRVPVRRPRPEPIAPLVQELRLDAAPVRALHGRVLGPGDAPVMGARVDLPGLGRTVRTDRHGRFHFSAVPAGRPTRLHVTAKGRELDMTAEPTAEADADGPVIIRMDFPAEKVEV